MGEISDRIAELESKKPTVVICRSGGRSAQVAQFLERQGFEKVFNLSGGILAWSRVIDPRIPQY
jgi:rhodanese-related sulfurtransferase